MNTDKNWLSNLTESWRVIDSASAELDQIAGCLRVAGNLILAETLEVLAADLADASSLGWQSINGKLTDDVHRGDKQLVDTFLTVLKNAEAP